MNKILSSMQTLWITLKSLGLMIETSYRAIFLAKQKHLNRKAVNDLLQSWTKRILAYAKVDYHVFNPHHVKIPPKRAVILMCNHASLYDIPLSFLAFPKASMRMLAKKELGQIPLFGHAMKHAEFPTVSRHHRQQAIEDLKAVKALLLSGIVMWIAPEGTRSKDGSLGPFKKGGFITALETDAVIIPIGIRGADKILPAKSLRLNLHQRAEVHIGKPVDATAYTLANKEQLITAVRENMLDALGTGEK